jgi:hypothetical protein
MMLDVHRWHGSIAHDCRWFNPVFHASTYLEMYDGDPENFETWQHLFVEELIPPDFRRAPGCPKTKRYVSQATKQQICQACGGTGHHAKSCTAKKTKFIYESNQKMALDYAQKIVSHK